MSSTNDYKNTSNSPSATKLNSVKCTSTSDCKNTTNSASTPKSKSDKCTLSYMIKSPDTTSKTVKDKAFEHMKKIIFLINKIPFRKDDLDTIQYHSFVKNIK